MAAPKLVEQVGDARSTPHSVDLDHDRSQVRIRELICSSPEVYSFLVEKERTGALEKEVLRCLDVGVSVLKRVEVVSEMEFVETRVTALTERFGRDLESLRGALLQELERRFSPHQAGSYTALVNTFFSSKKEEFERIAERSLNSFGMDQNNLKNALEEFARDLSAKLDPDQRGSFFSELVNRIEERFGKGGALEGFLTAHLSLDREDSPLSRFLVRVERGLTELRMEIAEYKAATETRAQISANTPIKGKNLEEEVLGVLSRIARPFNGDYIEDVRSVSGPTGSKIGDFVYHVHTGGARIVLEVRNEPLASLPRALKTLEEAKTNRGAQYAIYLAGEEVQLQEQTGQWSEFDGDKAISHLGLLEVAVKVARARLAAEAAEVDGVDISAITMELGAVRRALKKLSTIKGEATGVQAAGDRIHKLVDELKSDIEDRLRTIDTAMAVATGPTNLQPEAMLGRVSS